MMSEGWTFKQLEKQLKWEDPFEYIRYLLETTRLRTVPVCIPGMSAFTGSVLGWIQIINQIKWCCGVILLIYNPAGLLNIKKKLCHIFINDKVVWDSRLDISAVIPRQGPLQPAVSRPLSYLDFTASAQPVAACWCRVFAVFHLLSSWLCNAKNPMSISGTWGCQPHSFMLRLGVGITG